MYLKPSGVDRDQTLKNFIDYGVETGANFFSLEEAGWMDDSDWTLLAYSLDFFKVFFA